MVNTPDPFQHTGPYITSGKALCTGTLMTRHMVVVQNLLEIRCPILAVNSLKDG